ncbi:RICIN domain-containing protein [Streptomyces jumonjinensis]|uniref:RICIN domain-containing protein n=1 Tax=Streptomyces jumonjinensis TaxID=1945 RepID=UPI00378E4852
MSPSAAATPAAAAADNGRSGALSTPWNWKNANGMKCLEIPGGSTAYAAAAVQWTCDGTNWQLWVNEGSGKLTEIRNHHSGMCLDAANGSTADGASVVQSPCYGTPPQYWF